MEFMTTRSISSLLYLQSRIFIGIIGCKCNMVIVNVVAKVVVRLFFASDQEQADLREIEKSFFLPI